MSNYPGIHPIWNIEPTPSQFSQLPDDDFLALLEKQFPRSMQHELTLSKDGDANINPQSINRLSLPGVSPPSDESSPSPSSNNTDPLSRRQSQSTSSRPGDNADESMALKRKASDDDLVEGPSSKSKHAGPSSVLLVYALSSSVSSPVADESGTKKGQPTKRKSTGNPQVTHVLPLRRYLALPPEMQDESRLLKRKEQNRAAQRAFRERKEKHVKDLEDKVADLEAKNEEAQAENNNLRDLLARLQEENMTLKQSQFTFSVPKPGSSSTPVPPSTNASTSSSLPPASPLSFFGGPGPITPLGADIDWSALTTFDPAMLNMLDEPPISDVPMQPQSQHQQADFSSSPYGQYALPPPNQYRTIANNPWLMSFADTPDTTSATTVASPVNISGANGVFIECTMGTPTDTHPANVWSTARARKQRAGGALFQ
ncbi:hypothetical protein ID866_10688 [Astraeus odoratus]|nr:hypothetical protein ID866_10688 [Astraeus odoratus]